MTFYLNSSASFSRGGLTRMKLNLFPDFLQVGPIDAALSQSSS